MKYIKIGLIIVILITGIYLIGGRLMEHRNPEVTIVMENYTGEIIIELKPDKAPNTVNNFIHLIKEEFYDGLTFHRIIEGFMIQGGDPRGTGTGGPGYAIKGEFASNGFDNELKHTRGVISMARSMHPDSAGSQFFIMHEDNTRLDGEYAAFGKVISGMEIVDKIAAVETGFQDRPVETQVMEKVTVNTFRQKYDQPEIIQ